MEEDERFAGIASDPRFKPIPKRHQKVKIDKRFQSMFKDKNFKVKYMVDKRGRPVNRSSSEDLKRYYQMSDSSDEKSSEDEEAEEEEDGTVKSSGEEENEPVLDAKDGKLSEDVKKKLRGSQVDYARGEGALESSSGEEEEEEDIDEGDQLDHGWGELDRDAETTDEVTRRLAVCNMDWDRIRATDLMVLFNSFLPPGGVIESVTVYPSEFGLQRMKEEEIKGPPELTQNADDATEDSKEENEEGSKYHMEKLRQYQLNRLKYYYAVVVCDTEATANKIYTECDGHEYESSATKIDLRFIPDDMTFDHEPKESCDKIPELAKYQPRYFTTTALQQAKVNLTWDETDPGRQEITQKFLSGKTDDITDADIQAYLGSSSEEEEAGDDNDDDENGDSEDNKNGIAKYVNLLQDIEKSEEQKKNRGVEMQITWDLNLEKSTEQLVKKKMKESEEKTPFEKYVEKRKEKRKARREEKKKKLKETEDSEDDDVPAGIDMSDPYFAEEFDTSEFKKKVKKGKKPKAEPVENDPELELLLLDDEKKHFSLNDSKKKKKKKSEANEIKGQDDFEINVNDDRFSAMYTSHLYNIDPTDPNYNKTKGMEVLVKEKLKRKATAVDDSVQTKIKKDAEVTQLVKSVKSKMKGLKTKKK